MAIEREIPYDIKAIKPKLFGMFTTRQVLCLIPMGAAALTAFLLFKEWSTAAKFVFLTVFVVPFGLIGWKEVYGLPFEKFMKSIFVSTFLAPTHRKYRSAKLEDTLDSENEPGKAEKSNVSQKKKKKRKKTTDPQMQPFM